MGTVYDVSEYTETWWYFPRLHANITEITQQQKVHTLIYRKEQSRERDSSRLPTYSFLLSHSFRNTHHP